jgi:hypothetical protein
MMKKLSLEIRAISREESPSSVMKTKKLRLKKFNGKNIGKKLRHTHHIKSEEKSMRIPHNTQKNK